jgi:transposase
VRLVAPYRMSGVRGKNDAADAAAICEAVQRPAMRFVPVKTIDQQARLTVYRARQGYAEARTACINRLRGLLSELSIVLPLKAATVRREAGTSPFTQDSTRCVTEAVADAADPEATSSAFSHGLGRLQSLARWLRPTALGQERPSQRTYAAFANKWNPGIR